MGIKVLLVYPNAFGVNLLPPALGIFTALLKEHGHTVDLFDGSEWDLTFANGQLQKLSERKDFFHIPPLIIPPDIEAFKEAPRETDVFSEFRTKITNFFINGYHKSYKKKDILNYI